MTAESPEQPQAFEQKELRTASYAEIMALKGMESSQDWEGIRRSLVEMGLGGEMGTVEIKVSNGDKEEVWTVGTDKGSFFVKRPESQ